jgi:hypothetical protein
MGTIVDSSHVRFEAYTGAQGNFEQFVKYADGERESLKGTYTVNDAKKEIIIKEGNQTKTLKANVSGNTMEWAFTQDGDPVVVKATKR